MRTYTVRDFTLLKKLQARLQHYDCNGIAHLKNLKHCMARSHSARGVTISKTSDGKVGVQGLTYCHNSWACPSCAPYQMNRIKQKLTLAFAMMKERGYRCRMVTFTVPHARLSDGTFMKLDDIFYLLRNVYNSCLSGTMKHVRSTDSRTFSIFEITWSPINGWHPHIHALYWLKPDDMDKFIAAEKRLQESWKVHCEKILKQMTWLSQNEYNRFYNCLQKGFSKGVFISDHDADTSNYFWSGENEVADLLKKTAKTHHLTSWQILARALDNDDKLYWNLYIEMIKAVRAVQHWRFKRGFLSEINEYEKDHPIEKIEKKKQQPEKEAKTVCWFTREQWNYNNIICPHFLPLIASFVAACEVDEAFNLICELCTVYRQPPPLKESPLENNSQIGAAA